MAEDMKDRSFILVEFERLSSVGMINLQLHNCSPMQLLALAEFLRVNAQADLLQLRQTELNKLAQAQIATPATPQIVVPGR